MTTLFGRLRAAWRMLTRSQQLENEMRAEMQLHLELEAVDQRHRQLDGARTAKPAAVSPLSLTS